MIKQFGMPRFFLTLAADETSSLRWKDVTYIEDIAKTINPSMSWTNFPVECVILFHACVEIFMHNVLLCGPKILGTIDQYFIQYELQSQVFMHAISFYG